MEVPQGDTYHIHFTTRSFSTGAPTALTSGTFAVYEESTSTPIQTTQALTASINSVTGLNLVSVVATSGNGYDVGSYYNVSLDAGTVDSVSVVGEVVGHFRCVEPEGVAGVKEVNVNAWNDVALGTTNPLPNAAAGAAGGLPTDSTGKTSFNDIAATAVVSGGAITTSGGAVSTVTTTTTATNLTTNNDKTGYTLSATGVDEVWDEVITSGAHNTADSAAKYLRQLRTNGVYLNGAVFVDTLNGTAGTEDYENGTDHNPVDLIASANTIATSVGLTKFHIANGSTITFAASQAGDEFVGEAWTLALGTQSIVGCYIEGATVSGVGNGNGVGTTQIFEHCIVGATTVPKGTIFRECAFTGTLTFGEAGDIRLVHCVSGIAGASSPTIDMGAAVGASTLELRGWAGGITLNNLATGDVVTLDGTFGTITLNGADATVEIRGSYKALTNNLTGSPTVNDAAANLQTIDANVDLILADTADIQPNYATSAAQTTAQNDLDIITGSDGVTLATAQGLYAPSKAGDAMALTAGAVDDVWDETLTAHVTADSAAVHLKDILADTNEMQGDLVDGGRIDMMLQALGDATATDIPGQITALNDLSAAQVNAEVADVVKTDTITLPGQVAPPLTPTLEGAVAWLYKNFRNYKEQDASQFRLYADNGTTIDNKAAVSDDGTDATKGKIAAGP
jgi:hypothetical protein